MTNILILPQFTAANLSFTVTQNADWNDVIAFLMSTSTPIDITGIVFKAEWRASIGGTEVFLIAQTSDGTLTNGGSTGLLTFNIPQATLAGVFTGVYVMDLIAMADGHIINLYREEGPATVTLTAGVTNPSPSA